MPPVQFYSTTPGAVVRDGLAAVLATSPTAAVLEVEGDDSIHVVVDTSHDKHRRVAVVSGGGSGHEPHAAGYVGPGLLTAAVCGQVFASPSTAAVAAALSAAASCDHGAVLIVLNYTGDRLNFGAAAAAAVAGGTPVEVVYVADDVALLPEADSADVDAAARRARGLAACAFVFKVAGAAAAAGMNVQEVARLARAAADAAATTGVAATACALPGRDAPDRVPAGSLEFGLGLHGEPGAAVMPAAGGAAAVVDRMLAAVAAARHARTAWPPAGSRAPAALLVNNLGAASALEVAAILAAALERLDKGNDWAVTRVAAGPLATSLDMRGVSLTLLPLTDELTAMLDAPAAAPGWPSTGAAARVPGAARVVKVGAAAAAPTPSAATPPPDSLLAACIRAAAAAVTAKAGELDDLDGRAGDGDCGATLAAGAAAAVAALDGGRLPLGSPADTLRVLGTDVLGKMGGTSGAIYGILAAAAATAVGDGATPGDWAAALQAGAAAVSSHGGAEAGHRTLLDALLPASAAATAAAAAGAGGRDVASAAARAAAEGAAATATMAAGAGRAAAVRADAVAGVPDAGAVGAAEWLAAVAEAVEQA